jgi:hypothetical protein
MSPIPKYTCTKERPRQIIDRVWSPNLPWCTHCSISDSRSWTSPLLRRLPGLLPAGSFSSPALMCPGAWSPQLSHNHGSGLDSVFTFWEWSDGDGRWIRCSATTMWYSTTWSLLFKATAVTSLLDILTDWYCSYSLSNKVSKQILLRQYMLDKQKQVDKDSSKILFYHLPPLCIKYKIIYITLDIFENKMFYLKLISQNRAMYPLFCPHG